MKGKIQVVLAVLLCMALVLAGCTGPAATGEQSASAAPGTSAAGQSEAVAEKVLKVGILAPITGECAKAGQETVDAATMAMEKSGYKIGDYKIEPIIVDVTTDPEKGCLALEQAIIKDGIQVALYSYNSSVVMAMLDVVAKYKLPWYFDFGGASGAVVDKYRSDVDKYNYFIAKGMPRPENLAATSYISVIEEAMAAGTFTPANKNIAIYGDDNDWGRSIGGAIGGSFIDAGWTQVSEDFFPMGTTDFYAILSSIKAKNPSIIAGTISSPASAGAFLKQVKELDIDAVVICDALSENADYYSLAGDAVNYVLDNRPIWTSAEGKAYAAEFEARFGYAPAAFNAGQVTDFWNFFVICGEEAIAKYGALDSESLYKYGNEVLMKGGIEYTDGLLMPSYKYSEETAPDPVLGADYYTFPIIQFIGEDIYALWPSSMVTGEFKLS